MTLLHIALIWIAMLFGLIAPCQKKITNLYNKDEINLTCPVTKPKNIEINPLTRCCSDYSNFECSIFMYGLSTSKSMYIFIKKRSIHWPKRKTKIIRYSNLETQNRSLFSVGIHTFSVGQPLFYFPKCLYSFTAVFRAKLRYSNIYKTIQSSTRVCVYFPCSGFR